VETRRPERARISRAKRIVAAMASPLGILNRRIWRSMTGLRMKAMKNARMKGTRMVRR
jgi:hypothetical protein